MSPVLGSASTFGETLESAWKERSELSGGLGKAVFGIKGIDNGEKPFIYLYIPAYHSLKFKDSAPTTQNQPDLSLKQLDT